jgi:hypothetical protein
MFTEEIIKLCEFIWVVKVNSSHRGGPGSNPGLVMWDFVMDKSGAEAGFL